MKTNLLILVSIIFILKGTSQESSESIKPLTIGEQIKHSSTILNEERLVNIYLPQNYGQDSLKTYPVIYLLDGGMNEDFIHVSGLIQFGSFSWVDLIPESIIVGISSRDRKRDFTFPTTIEEDQLDYPTSGGSEKFMAYIEQELKPLIENRYKIGTKNSIIGQSLGGLLVSEILVKKPDMFDNYIVVSPSLWWNNLSLIKEVKEKTSSKINTLIITGKEGYNMTKDAKKLYRSLKKLKNNNISFKRMKKYNHANILYPALYYALETKILNSKTK